MNQDRSAAYIARQDPRNSMTHWYPIVERTSVPMPRTLIFVPANPSLQEWEEMIMSGDECKPEWVGDLVNEFRGLGGGFPAFVRTCQSSIKHEFRSTCFADDEKRLEANLENLLLQHMMKGIPVVPEAVVLREYLAPAVVTVGERRVEPFRAFGGIPIGAERRYFVRDGVVECHHPYWPEDVIRGVESSAGDWRARLKYFNREDEAEVALLTGYAEQIGAVLPGYWSVDFMFTEKRGWVFIDAALGECSAHLPCLFCPEGQGVR